MQRREFIVGGLAASAIVSTSLPVWAQQHTGVVRATGSDPYKITRRAVDALGGMRKFVKRGQRVVIIPNIGWQRKPEYGANTNPEVVRAIIEMCKECKPSAVSIICNPCGDPKVCLNLSGIGDVINRTGVHYIPVGSANWRNRSAVSGCTYLRQTEVYSILDNSDVIINVPICKHHGGSGMTMCMKNLMGVIKNRGAIHQNLDLAIPDLALMIPTTLCILDCTRVLISGGPSGGNLGSVLQKNTVLAGLNPAEVDMLGSTFIKENPTAIGAIAEAIRRGMAPKSLKQLKITNVRA